jgi:hypothetical protein
MIERMRYLEKERGGILALPRTPPLSLSQSVLFQWL